MPLFEDTGRRARNEFTRENKLSQDMCRRNEDQVVTKELDGSTVGLNWWNVLRVDQLWLWVIDDGEY